MPDRPPGDVLVVTLALDDDAQARFDALRRAHFPPERNHLAAHVTLFSALPLATAMLDDVRAAAAERDAFAVHVPRLRSLGRGVAYVLASDDLLALRRDLARQWAPLLGRQDRAWSAPHVTVQNKVPPEQARALLADLTAQHVPHDVTATGLSAWRYLGGPWEHLLTAPFRAP